MLILARGGGSQVICKRSMWHTADSLYIFVHLTGNYDIHHCSQR